MATAGGPHRVLNSLNNRADLFGGPNVAVPPKNLMAPPTHISKLSEMVTHEQSSSNESTPINTPMHSPPPVTTDDFALAFDIDGVLMKGGQPIPEAVDAMKYINGENPYGVKVPYIFLTNGGGKTEKERCLDLSRQLDLDVDPGQFICGHTPMREMAERYGTVLVVGGEGEKCRVVAEGYGFKDVITPGDIIKTRHDTTPFRTLTDEEHDNSRLLDLDNTRIEAIFVFADSRDWAGDQQIILDCLMTKDGWLNTRSEIFTEGPPVFFSHTDVVWSTSHDYSRLGMGALRASLEAVYFAITGKDLNTIAFGKPQIGTYQFATRLLQQWRKESCDIDRSPSTVYFIGDTPESDIRGTNEFNETTENDWYSILVKTGVYQDGDKPRFPPRKTVETVLDAVKFAFEREHRKTAKGEVVSELDYDTSQQVPN
ncbi:HAD-superfamily hydrolase subfamily IIA CECR5 [Penicillium brevicompactum]|uniref:HAD-superfamily hydrolase subfamily IIA CECR5 n=1 Tax=Penicillium brevicompactum TaxID=5074 RepID=A0A9W9QM64_PENBR|nr:HAD-superfamily hydrolase subfamily IIA CECR5 [Penicillium brevicompactum]KAJ5327577.1 HAD-superfamily hydrolase subfamily IIA CECR5 [Penicillium brevicompactum]KAJ5337619.1 HAD-superfamily hydrolase subfamily IIA CECR5 [Penicillium brevicompactum]KAJ5340483.1 HAD-superfamily hydrolase subfamily IIA CECR5 [Penicillium brevicompactum]